jgi:hypothetical protein
VSWLLYRAEAILLWLTEQEKKDKVGERVAALQQLVSPFGKVLVWLCNVLLTSRL